MHLLPRPSVVVPTLVLAGLWLAGCRTLNPPEAPPKHLLWAVASPTNTVYLLGSIHILRPEIYPLPDPLEAAYEDADIVAFEVDLGEAQSGRFMERGLLLDGSTLRAHVAPETYTLVRQTLDTLQLSPSVVERMEPWMAGLTLNVLTLLKYGFNPEAGIDAYFYRRAVRDGKPRQAFETVDDQINLFDSLPPKEQDAFLRYSLHEVGQLATQVDTLTALWQRGDADTLARKLGGAFNDFDDLSRRINRDRNRAWLPQVEALIGQQENALVVVGALHLVGKDGLVALLRQRGYTVEQM